MIMKKLLLLVIALFLIGAGFGQKVTKYVPVNVSGVEQGDGYSTDASIRFGGLTPGDPNTDILQAWVVPSQGSTSGNTRCPGNTWRYQRTEYLIMPSEMAASGYPSGQTVDGIGFLIGTAGTTSQTGNLKVYLMNTPNTTYQLGTSWTTAGFTKVCEIAAFTVPIAAGSYTINFAGGDAPFTYTGGGVYVAWEFSNPVGTLGTGALVALCNSTGLLNGLYGQRSATSMPTTLAASSFRPATFFVNNALTDILTVTNIYTTEKAPIPFGIPNKVSVMVNNVSASSATFDLTLSINSTPPVTVTQSGLTIAANTSLVYDFLGWNPTYLQNVNVTATATPGAGENFLLNNTNTITVQVNNNLFSYCFNNVASGAYGYGTGSVIWASKYNMSGPGKITGANIYIYSSTAPNSSVGNTVSAVVLNSAGVIVAQSAGLLLTAGNVNAMNNFTFATPPVFNNEAFYVGLFQPTAAAAWYPMGYMSEAPQRPGTFYIFAPTGGVPSAAPPDVKWMIEAQVAPVPGTIPTLSQWGLILLGLTLLGFGTFYILRRGA